MGNKSQKPAKTSTAPAAPGAPAPAAAPKTADVPQVDPSAKHPKYNLTMAEYEQHYQGWQSIADNGRINKEKFVNVMVSSGTDREMAELLFASYDADGSGDVDMDEFLGHIALTLNGSEEEQLRASFHAFDKDRNGTMTKDELRFRIRTILRRKRDGTPRTEEELAEIEKEVDKTIDEVFDLIDTDKSGSIDIEEYVRGFSANRKVAEFIDSLLG